MNKKEESWMCLMLLKTGSIDGANQLIAEEGKKSNRH